MGKYNIKYNTSGIYKIISLYNNEFYIGSAKCYNKRISLHVTKLKQNKHHSKYLQNIYNKHGIDNLKFELIKECDKSELIKNEQYYIDTLKPKLNSRLKAENNLGFKQPESFYNKMCKPVLEIDKTGKIIAEYPSAREASIKNNLNRSSISHFINSKNSFCMNRLFIYKENFYKLNIKEEINNREILKKEKNKIRQTKRLLKITGKKFPRKNCEVLQYTLNGEFIKEWNSRRDILDYFNSKCSGNLSKVLLGKRNNFQGFNWKYKNK